MKKLFTLFLAFSSLVTSAYADTFSTHADVTLTNDFGRKNIYLYFSIGGLLKLTAILDQDEYERNGSSWERSFKATPTIVSVNFSTLKPSALGFSADLTITHPILKEITVTKSSTILRRFDVSIQSCDGVSFDVVENPTNIQEWISTLSTMQFNQALDCKLFLNLVTQDGRLLANTGIWHEDTLRVYKNSHSSYYDPHIELKGLSADLFKGEKLTFSTDLTLDARSSSSGNHQNATAAAQKFIALLKDYGFMLINTSSRKNMNAEALKTIMENYLQGRRAEFKEAIATLKTEFAAISLIDKIAIQHSIVRAYKQINKLEETYKQTTFVRNVNLDQMWNQ